MKSGTVVLSKEEQAYQNKIIEEQKDMAMSQAMQRKQKMLQMDKERLNKQPPSDYQRE